MGVLNGSLRKGLTINPPSGHFPWAQPVWAGVAVTNETAMHVAAYFAGVRVIVEDIGKLPFIVYSEGSNGERERATFSPFWRLIHDAPNRSMSSQQFRELLTCTAINRGDGCAIKAGPRGRVQELLPLHPDNVRIELMPDWSLMYHVRHVDGTEDHLTREKVLHLPGLTLNGFTGVSVIEYARQTLGNIHGANRHAGTFFANGMKPSGVFTHPGELKKDAYDQLKSDLDDQHNGANSNRTLLLEAGLKFETVSLNSRDSQFLESRIFEVVEVCRWLRIKPHKIAELTRSTNNNIEQESRDHVVDTLTPWGQRWKAAITSQVIDTPGVYAELLYDSLLMGTTRERYEAYQIATGGPWMRLNEARRAENLSPVEGGDEVRVPLNMTAASAQGGFNV